MSLGSLELVAGPAGQAQVLLLRGPTGGPGDDVINAEGAYRSGPRLKDNSRTGDQHLASPDDAVLRGCAPGSWPGMELFKSGKTMAPALQESVSMGLAQHQGLGFLTQPGQQFPPLRGNDANLVPLQ